MSVVDDIRRESSVAFRPADPEAIEQLRSLGAPEDALLFFAENEPADCAEINKVRLWPIGEIVRENSDYVPGADIQPLGYAVFATTVYGDAFCFDTNSATQRTTAPIVLMAHDLNWNDVETRKNIGNLAKPIAPTLEVFLEMYAAGTLDIKPLYPEWKP